MTVPHADGPYVLDRAGRDTPLDSLPAGTNLLFVGDDRSGATDLVYRILAGAPAVGECVILVTTDADAGALVERYQSTLSEPDSLDHLFVVDASDSGLARDIGPLSPTHVEAASSPVDITGIGVGVTNHLRSLDTDRVRLGMVSLSPILERLGAERTFAFCHVLTSRIRSAGHLGLFVVDPSRHAAEHVDILQSLVDGSFRFRTVDGERQFRGTGAVAAVDDWASMA
ncbi:DUF7504 family protein [Salinigranum halophilum]|uniref:DUF7504 family protein n=1 Tax=Salinigranum halophilum TaxID=2565931 RepID=UPI0010A93F06|nr:hypothetical protein [Salinigranum halophilum]